MTRFRRTSRSYPSDPVLEQREAIMGERKAWAGKVGDGLVDFGTRAECVRPGTTDCTSPGTREVAGYGIIEAASTACSSSPATPAPDRAGWMRDRGPRGM